MKEGFYKFKEISCDLFVSFSSEANWYGGCFSVEGVIAAVINKSHDFKNKSGFLVLYNGLLSTDEFGRLKLKTEKISLNISYPTDVADSEAIYLK